MGNRAADKYAAQTEERVRLRVDLMHEDRIRADSEEARNNQRCASNHDM